MRAHVFLSFCLLSHVVFAAEPQKKDIDSASISPIVPLVIVGEGWSQQLVIKNVDDEDSATGTLKFFTADGQAWRVDLRGRGTADEFFVTLRPGQMAVYETTVKGGAQQLGWAEFDLDCCARVHAQSLFRKQTPGRPDLMTSIVLGSTTLRTLHIPFDNRDGKFAGVGVLTQGFCSSFSGCGSQEMRWRIKDENGNVIREFVASQVDQTLDWFSLTADYPETAGRMGSIEVSGLTSEDFVRLVGFSLQFTPNGAFTVVTPYER